MQFAMEASEQSESSLTVRSRCHAIVLFETFTGSVYTRSNLNYDGDSIAEPYLYEPEVEHPLYLQLGPPIMKGSSTQTGEAKHLCYFGSILDVSLA